MMRALIFAALLMTIGRTALSDEDIVIGDTTACHLRIEYEAKEQMLRLRPTIPVNADCEITPLMLQAGLYQALDRYRDIDLKFIFLGRLESYHWLSEALF